MATLEKPKTKKKSNKTKQTTVTLPEIESNEEIEECSSKTETSAETTATAIEHPTISKLKENIKIVTYPQLPCTESSEIIEKQPKHQEFIKPFTETQLTGLYSNQEITASTQFIEQFTETELRGINAKKHPLYGLISSYLAAREKEKEIRIELNQLRNDSAECQNQLWSLNDTSICAKGQCVDNCTVTATHPYKTATFQRNILKSLMLLQKKIKRLSNHVYTLYSYNCCLFKLKIEYYLDTVYRKCESSLNLSSGVTLLEENEEGMGANGALQELRLCISVLFYFQRQLHKDKDVLVETRQWLTNMISLLLRNANWQDHMYLLNHVLRCPAGINTWAIHYIQVPSPLFYEKNDAPFANRYVNHIISVLSVILMPIRKRDAFLEQIISTLNEPTDMVAENLWVLVDSDGESDDDNTCGILSLKENDLVSLLNQIPLDYLFRAVLLIEHKDNQDLLNIGELTEHHILRLFAFSTVLVKLLNNGLAAYSTMRYNQFAKRLCRLMRHILQYVSDAWEIFKSSNNLSDRAMLNRLQVEFDAFFLRTTVFLFDAQARGSWQFLAIAPFHMVSTHTLWQFFYLLHQDSSAPKQILINHEIDFKEKLMETCLKQQFYDRLCVMSVEQAYYLLNTFGNMIMARKSDDDDDFIQFATLNLLQIGFTETENQESSRKCAAILLSNVTQKYPKLISDILMYIRANIDHLESLIFLFSELPLFLWQPEDTDIDVLSSWMLEKPINSVESFLARKILLNLNWNFSDNRSQELFLPLRLHRRMAVLIVEAVEKFVPQHIQSYDSAKSNPENSFIKFAWCLVLQLRLHSIDRGTLSVENVPDLIRFDVIQRGVREKMAVALYCAVAMTTVGHLLPLVCADGLTCLEHLTALWKYEAVLIGLYYIAPLFLENIEALLMCTSYQNIISNILNADKTFYSKMGGGTVLKHFCNLIEMHLHHPDWHPLFVFWTKTLFLVPQWNSNKMVLFLLNRIVAVAFFLPEIYQQIEILFHEILIQKINDRSNGSNSLLSWVPIVGNSQSGTCFLVPGNTSEETWLMYLIISLEHQEIEMKSGLWYELLKQLFAAKGKTNIDTSLKKAANILKIPTYSSNGLCIYRWCQLALDTPLDHPLLPLIWQKFFSLYLIRVPGAENNGSVGSKFFDGVINTTFLKKLKKRLIENVEYLKTKLEADETNKELLEKCLNIFKAYILWLEEPLIMEPTLYLPSLPPQYEPRYLSHMIQKTTSPWTEFINYESLRKNYEDSCNKWMILCERFNKYRPPLQKTTTGDVTNPIERVLRRLNSYDNQIPPPNFSRSVVVIPTINITKSNLISGQFHPQMRKLQQYAEVYALQVSEHIALENQYNELMPQLYQNFKTKITMKKTCKPSCAGVANIQMIFTESRMNESIKHQIESNRLGFGSLFGRSLQPPATNMCVSCACFEQTVDSLINQLLAAKCATNAQKITPISSLGTELFYFLLSEFNEELRAFPPTHQTFHKCLEKLGRAFLLGVEDQALRLLKKIIEKPEEASLLIPHFVPLANFNSHVFLDLYQEIENQIQNIPDVMFSVVSKFNVSEWLLNESPRLIDRSKFIQILFECLCKTGKKQQQLHEIYRRHLLIIFQYDFPNHYGEILLQMLQHSGQQTISVIVWFDIINALSPIILINSSVESNLIIREVLRRHATQQQMLRRPELHDTIDLLSRYFSQERLQFGLYGLYPKYRLYIHPISVFLGQSYHAYTIATLHLFSGEVANDLVAVHLWPKIVELFGPWLIPYSVKDANAAWIQQLTDDRAVLLPWIQADISHAQFMFNMFVDCVLFIADTLPASNTLLSNVWQFYAQHFAHTSIKEHILVVVHNSLSQIRWEMFSPSLIDLQIMLKVLDEYMPECHSFLGKVFVEVNWSWWLIRLMQIKTNNCEVLSGVHHCLLHLLVKLTNEPSVRQNVKAMDLLEKSSDFNSWFLLDVKSLESVLDWYIMSSDPRVVLLNNTELIKQIDNVTYQLLKTVSYYNININEIAEKKQVIQKQQTFVRALIKMLVNCSTRYKNLFTSNPQLFTSTINAQLDYLETLLNKAENQNDSDVLVREFLMLLNNPSLSQLAITCFNEWVCQRTGTNVLLCAILRTAHVISDDDSLTCLLEQVLCSFFNDIPSPSDTPSDANWIFALQLLDNLPPKQKIETILIQNGRLLTLYSILLKKIKYLDDCEAKSSETLLETIINWLMNVKGNDLIEDKLPLFWVQVIRLSLKLCHHGNEEKAAILLKRFVNQHLLLIAENKSAPTESNAVSWGRGLLGAIGLIKQNAVSLQCRFLCKSIGAYILAQLPDTKNKSASVRCFSSAGYPVGQPGGNTECARILLKLEPSGTTPELKAIVETSLKQIQDPQNSLHNGEDFLFSLINILHLNKNYLQYNTIQYNKGLNNIQ